MDKILIEGGRRLSGDIEISGAKNAALPIIFSSLLTDKPCRFSNVPNLADIETTKLLLSKMGVEFETSENFLTVHPKGLNNWEAPYDLVRKMRASVLVLGPLLARLKKARVALPGGCAIGARPIDLHIKGLAALGAKTELKHGYVEIYADKLKGAEIDFDKVTVTGTENLMMAAALANGTTVLKNAACEPEVKALADSLNSMGADIKGAGSPVITIKGVSSLGAADVEIIPDRIETGTFMVAAAITAGDVTIKKCIPEHIRAVISKIKETGAIVQESETSIRVQGIPEIESTDIETAPYPGFPTDMQAQFMALMAYAKGVSMISENIFENRFMHTSELKRMGADIKVSGNIAVVKGAATLFGAEVMASDLRASASLIIAGLAAKGATTVSRVYHLDRGYDAIDKKFKALGAAIKRIK